MSCVVPVTDLTIMKGERVNGTEGVDGAIPKKTEESHSVTFNWYPKSPQSRRLVTVKSVPTKNSTPRRRGATMVTVKSEEKEQTWRKGTHVAQELSAIHPYTLSSEPKDGTLIPKNKGARVKQKEKYTEVPRCLP